MHDSQISLAPHWSLRFASEEISNYATDAYVGYDREARSNYRFWIAEGIEEKIIKIFENIFAAHQKGENFVEIESPTIKEGSVHIYKKLLMKPLGIQAEFIPNGTKVEFGMTVAAYKLQLRWKLTSHFEHVQAEFKEWSARMRRM